MDSVYPPIVDGAHATSAEGQKRFVRLTGATLVLSCLAAIGGAVPIAMRAGGRELDLGALAGAAAFAAGFVLSLMLLVTRPQERWYQGRAAAESIKTLAWQYCVGGGSYPKSLKDPDRHLIAQIRKVILELPATGQPEADLTADQITDGMRGHRGASLAERRKLYCEGRIEDQRQWYVGKALEARRKSHVWLGVMIGAQVLGTALATLKGIGVLDVDLLGILGAIAASGAAWAQTKQYQALAASYDITSRELTAIQAEAPVRLAEADERKWAAFVEDAETAISREHTTWRARSGIS